MSTTRSPWISVEGLPFDLDIEFNGGEGGFDSLVLIANGSQTADYTTIGADSGEIRLSSGLAMAAISFTGLEPVTVNSLVNYTFTTSGGADVIVIDSPAPGLNCISGTTGGIAIEKLGVSERQACKSLGQNRSTRRYELKMPQKDRLVTEAIREQANKGKHRRYGYRRITEILCRLDWIVNHKRV